MRQLRPMVYAAVLAALAAPIASGQTWNVNKTTFLTFSGPVQVPGASLPAGTYMFRLADSMSHRQVIQIRDKDGSRLFTTALSVPNQAAKPKDDPYVMFLETPSGQPGAIKAWFYPGERTGYEFVYPKDQAMRIAKYSKSSVLAHSGNVTDSTIADSKVGRVDSQGQFTEESQASSAQATTADTPAEPARSASSASAVPAPSANRTQSGAAVGTAGQTGTARARQLPRTASALGLMQLLSGVALAAGLALRQRRKYAAETRG